jgi:hypothetical protein
MIKEGQNAFVQMSSIGTLQPGEVNKSRPVKITPRIDSLPPALQAERERIRKEAARKSQGAAISVPEYDYPPNSKSLPCPQNPLAELTIQHPTVPSL